MGSCVASCLHHCDCCVCDCCYGELKQGFSSQLDLSLQGKGPFNNPFSLVLYDKWVKEDKVYAEREKIFEEIKQSLVPSNDSDFTVLDLGVGTGVFVPIISQKFIKEKNGTLICMDTSPQALQFVRNRVVDCDDELKNLQIEYFCNEHNSLCFESVGSSSPNIDVVVMSFVLHQISLKKGDRDKIMKELYDCMKENALLITFEFGTSTSDEDKKDGVSRAFESAEVINEYIKTFGFQFEKRICEDTFGESRWISMFRKVNNQNTNSNTSTNEL